MPHGEQMGCGFTADIQYEGDESGIGFYWYRREFELRSGNPNDNRNLPQRDKLDPPPSDEPIPRRQSGGH